MKSDSLHRALPGIDQPASVICLGTAMLGTANDRAASFALLDEYLDAGGNFLDTAKVYSDWVPGERSRSEKLLGTWMAERGNRARLVLATKGAHAELPGTALRVTPQHITSDLEGSLINLRTDVIDLYWLHRDDPIQPIEGLIDTLNAHQKAGKIRAFGCSNWTAARIRAANAYAKSSGQHSFAANQPMWSAAVTDAAAVRALDKTLAVMDANAHALHRETKLACVPYSSQANGLFNKMAAPASTIQQLQRGGLRGWLWRTARDAYRRFKGAKTAYPRAANLRRFAVIQRVARDRNLTITQVTLAYLLSQPFPVFPIVGCRTVEQLRDSLSAAPVRLEAASLAAIDAAR
jgi:aryl-alcohol dehydrogenase-like predicted oxidoreductase